MGHRLTHSHSIDENPTTNMDQEEEGSEQQNSPPRRMESIIVQRIPAGMESSSSSDEEEEQELRQNEQRQTLARRSTNALQNILSVLIERGDSFLGANHTDSESSGESESDHAFWPHIRRPRPNKIVKPEKHLVKELEESDFSIITKLQLHSELPCQNSNSVFNKPEPDHESQQPQESEKAEAGPSSKGCKIKIKFNSIKKKMRGSKNKKEEEEEEDLECDRMDQKSSDPDFLPDLTDSQQQLRQDGKSSLDSRRVCKPVILPSIVSKREIGDFRHQRNFSPGMRCQVMDHFIPNHKKQVAKYNSKIFCGSYSTHGDIFMSACQDQQIRIHDTSRSEFKLIKSIRARNVGWSVLDTALSPDNRHLIYSSWCAYIHQVNVFGEEEKHDALALSPEDTRFCLFSLRFSADGRDILGGANDGYIYLYDREANSESLKISAHEDDVNAVAFVDTTTHILASGGDDGVCKIWDRRSLRESRPVPVGVLAGHVDGITFIDPRGDGRHLITNSKDQSIKLWDIRRFSPSEAVNETRLAVRNQNWDYRWQGVPRHLTRKEKRPTVEHDSSVMTYRGHTVLQTLIRCHFSPVHTTAQRYIYTGCATGSVVIYDALTGEVVKENVGHKTCVRDVSWHPYNPEMISSSWDYSLNQWSYKPDDVISECRKRNKKEAKEKPPEKKSPETARRSARISAMSGLED